MIQRRFALPEIIDLVCRQVRWKGLETQENTAILAAPARTCHAWSDIALDNLWHTIFGISSLVRCMPQDLWLLEGGVLTLRRPLVTLDMHVLRKSCVRVLNHREHPKRLAQVHSSIYQALLLSSNDCLLPGLEVLCWAPRDDSGIFHFIRLFLGPKLNVLDLTFGLDHIEQLGLLDTIPTTSSPHIFGLGVHNLRPGVAVFVPSAPPAWAHLTYLHIQDIILDDLVYIAGLPALNGLTFGGLSSLWTPQALKPGTEIQLLRSLHAVEQLFSALRFFNMKVYVPVEEVTKLFKLFRNIKLTRLTIFLEHLVDRADTLSEFIETVACNCHVDSLRIFDLVHSVHDVAFSTVFRPLLNFHALEFVIIRVLLPLKITDDEAVEIASSWPNIQTLGLLFRKPGCSLPSLLALLTFAKCIKLQKLCLIIDASDKVARQELRRGTDEERTCNYSLRALSVAWSPISHKEFVASFLSDVFPNLEDIHSSVIASRGNERDHQRWQYVGQILLPIFSRMREREHKRLGICIARRSPQKGSTRWFSDGVEDEDGDWSDAEELLDRHLLTTGGDSYKTRGFK